MTTTVELGYDPDVLAGFEAAHAQNSLPDDEELLANAAIYQQIADRRAQTENAEVLRRARSL